MNAPYPDLTEGQLRTYEILERGRMAKVGAVRSHRIFPPGILHAHSGPVLVEELRIGQAYPWRRQRHSRGDQRGPSLDTQDHLQPSLPTPHGHQEKVSNALLGHYLPREELVHGGKRGQPGRGKLFLEAVPAVPSGQWPTRVLWFGREAPRPTSLGCGRRAGLP